MATKPDDESTPRKRGRPATGHDPNRTIRIPDDVWARIKREAKRRGITVSKFVRDTMAEATATATTTATAKKPGPANRPGEG